LLKLVPFILVHFSREVKAEEIPSNTDPHGELLLSQLLHIIVIIVSAVEILLAVLDASVIRV